MLLLLCSCFIVSDIKDAVYDNLEWAQTLHEYTEDTEQKKYFSGYCNACYSILLSIEDLERPEYSDIIESLD